MTGLTADPLLEFLFFLTYGSRDIATSMSSSAHKVGQTTQFFQKYIILPILLERFTFVLPWLRQLAVTPKRWGVRCYLRTVWPWRACYLWVQLLVGSWNDMKKNEAYENVIVTTRSDPEAFPSALRQKRKTETKQHEKGDQGTLVSGRFSVFSLLNVGIDKWKMSGLWAFGCLLERNTGALNIC